MSSTKDVKYVKYGNRTEEEWKAVQEERRPEVYELLNRLGYTHKADIANLKIYQSANGFDIQDGITDQVYGAIIKDAALKGVLTNNQGSTLPPSAPASDSATNYSDYTNLLNYANDYKDSAYANASALRGASYEAALKARQEAEALAEIQRKRGVVDASTMAEQQKATYGANAEQLGRMGLNVSGYSDYLNSQAYANGMAYRQAANAQATDIKRQATYQEALARLEADKAYSQATAEADKTYYGAMKEIEAAKIADAKALEERLYKEQQQKEAQQQTNYGKLIDAIVSGNGVINKDNVETYASALGITDTKLLGDATNFATKYAENNANILTENKINELTNQYNNQVAAGDIIGSIHTATDINNHTADDGQKRIINARQIAAQMEDIFGSDKQLEKLSQTIGNYGEEGATIIKEAYTQLAEKTINTTTDEIQRRNAIEDAIDSGLLTEEEKSKLIKTYEKEFNAISVYEKGAKAFGSFAGSSSKTSEQNDYIKAIIDMVGNGTLQKGDFILANYGDRADFRGYYEYRGNGRFVRIKVNSDVASHSSETRDKIKLPPNYEWVEMIHAASGNDWNIYKKG